MLSTAFFYLSNALHYFMGTSSLYLSILMWFVFFLAFFVLLTSITHFATPAGISHALVKKCADVLMTKVSGELF